MLWATRVFSLSPGIRKERAAGYRYPGHLYFTELDRAGVFCFFFFHSARQCRLVYFFLFLSRNTISITIPMTMLVCAKKLRAGNYQCHGSCTLLAQRIMKWEASGEFPTEVDLNRPQKPAASPKEGPASHQAPGNLTHTARFWVLTRHTLTKLCFSFQAARARQS